MKKIIIFLIVCIFSFIPISYAKNLKEITYDDAQLKFTIEEDEWDEVSLTKERDYIDHKWESDCGVIMSGTYDIYGELSEDELEGLTRDDFNYDSLFTTDDYGESFANTIESDYGFEVNWEYKNYDVKFIKINGTGTKDNVDFKYVMYVTINNGYALMLQFMSETSNSSICTYTLNNVASNTSLTVERKGKYNLMGDLNIEYIILDILLTIIIFMTYPWYVITQKGKTYNEKDFKTMLKWNSLIAGLISLVIIALENADAAVWSAAPCFTYYYINKSVFGKNAIIKPKNKSKKHDRTFSENEIKYEDEITQNDKSTGKFKCSNCGAICSDDDKYCKNCLAVFDDDDESKTSKKEDKFKCSECGALVPASANKCPKCGARFEEDEEPKEKSKSKNEKFNSNTKYDDLIKLKELYDKEILTKEEFDKEKSKILNEKNH